MPRPPKRPPRPDSHPAGPANKPERHDKQATFDALIAAGMALFAERGLDGPSLDDICAHAGFTRGAFYVHFEDREDFLVAVMDQVGRKLLDELIVEGGDDIHEATARFLHAAATGKYPLMPAGGIRPHQLLEACARSSALRERYLGLVELATGRVRDLVARSQRDGLVQRDLDAGNMATLIVAVIVGLQTLADLGAKIALAPLATEVLGLLFARRKE